MKEMLLLAPVFAAAGSLKLFADEIPIDPKLTSLIGNVGVIGILLWYLWYNTSKAQPKQLETFTQEQEKLRASSEKSEEALRNAFASEQKELRATFSAEQAALRNTFVSEQEKIRDYAAKEATELRRVLMETLAAMRTAVHDVKDTAQKAIITTEAAVAKEVKKQGGAS